MRDAQLLYRSRNRVASLKVIAAIKHRIRASEESQSITVGEAFADNGHRDEGVERAHRFGSRLCLRVSRPCVAVNDLPVQV